MTYCAARPAGPAGRLGRLSRSCSGFSLLGCGAIAAILGALCRPAAAADDRPAAERALAPYRAPAAPRAEDWPHERLVGLMRDLADFVYRHHVVTDPGRAVYGMTYEFWQDGKQIQAFSLDAMHDGAWWASAMATAQRVDPDGGYLARAQKYQAPFYVNVIGNSDRLFAERMRRGWGKVDRPIKGWVPRGWDDGLGYDLGRRTPFAEGFEHEISPEASFVRRDGKLVYAYWTPSNHLAQDLSNGLLNLWLTTRDPQLAEAAAQVRDCRRVDYGRIPVCEFAAALMAGDAQQCLPYRPADQFAPDAMRPVYAGMHQQKGQAVSSYDDDLAWAFRRASAWAATEGQFSEGFALVAASRALGQARAMELYHDTQPYRFGIYFFDLQKQPAFVEGTGRLDAWLSDGGKLFGPRGVQISCVAAGVLPVLKKRPELWESYYRQHHAGEPLVRIVDTPPETDGRRDAAYDGSATLREGPTAVSLVADPKHVHLLVESSAAEVRVSIRPADPVVGQAREGRITITGAGRVAAANDLGEELLHAAAFAPGKPWTAELRLPNTAVKGQNHWINVVENGRYTVEIGGGRPHTVYVLSEPDRIVRRLENLALGTIETWNAVWQEMGLLPSAYRSPNMRVARWELSDAGGYAALVQTIALWLAYRQGASDWQLIRAQQPRQPLRCEPLPASVMAAQGL